MKKQIEEMAKAKKCNTCIHNRICQELEELRDPLGWVSTKDEFICSYYDNAGYRKASDVAMEIFAEIEKAFEPTISALFCISETLVAVSKSHINDEDAIKKIRDYLSGTISSKYRLNKMFAELKKKYESEGGE